MKCRIRKALLKFYKDFKLGKVEMPIALAAIKFLEERKKNELSQVKLNKNALVEIFKKEIL